MENCIFLNKLKNHFFASFSMLEKIIDICPDKLWNKKLSGFIFWQQILHTITGGLFWLRSENNEFIEPYKEKNVFPELEKDPENILSKNELKKCIFELKDMVEIWFSKKDDDWLKLPSIIYNKATNFDIIINQIKHFDYHIGHCESIFRNNNINTEKYVEYYGDN